MAKLPSLFSSLAARFESTTSRNKAADLITIIGRDIDEVDIKAGLELVISHNAGSANLVPVRKTKSQRHP
jgi:hypothetical protein